MGLRIEPAQPDMDAFALYDDMREEDMMECIGLMHHPKDAVYMSFEASEKVYSLRDDNGLYCSFGVTNAGNVGVAWLLGTRRLVEVKKYFVVNSKKWMNDLMIGYDCLTNVVMKSNELSVKWLRWLGAEFSDCQFDGYMSFILERK